MQLQASQWTWSAMSHQSFRLQMGRVFVLCIVCALLSYPLVWNAEYRTLTRGQRHLIDLQHEIERLNETVTALKAKQIQWQMLQHQMDEKTRLIVGSQDLAAFIGWLEKETLGHGVEIKRMTWPTPAKTKNPTDDFLEDDLLEIDRFDLKMTGHFYAILDVLNATSQRSPRLLFNHISWIPISEENTQLNVTAEGRMYRFDERQDRE